MKNIVDSTRIKVTRATAGMSQVQLAKAIGCSRNTICRAENGECSVGLATRLARYFSKPHDYFILSSQPAPAPNGHGPQNEKQRYVLILMQRNPRATFAVWEAALMVEKLLDQPSSDGHF